VTSPDVEKMCVVANIIVSGSSKISTVLYYNKNGGVRAVGAETPTREIYRLQDGLGKWLLSIKSHVVGLDCDARFNS
jgi:hypothetical protein